MSFRLSLVSLLFVVACGPAVGGECRDDRDCPRDGICCEADHCDKGMCTYECDRDRDCPRNTACEHGVCLLTCDRDRDCDSGQECKHGGVCEY